MRLVFTPHGWEDYQRWAETDRATLKRANRLIDDVLRDPFDGARKPEQLRHALARLQAVRRSRHGAARRT